MVNRVKSLGRSTLHCSKSFLFTFCFLLAGLVLMKLARADDVVVPLPDLVQQAMELGKGWGQLGAWAISAAVVNLLVNATKTDLLGVWFHKLPDFVQHVVIFGLAAISVGLAVKLKGGTLADILLAVVQSSAGAMLIHELWVKISGSTLTAKS